MKKKLAAVMAVIMSATMLMAGCTDKKPSETDVSANVITQEGEEGGQTDGEAGSSPSSEDGDTTGTAPESENAAEVWEQLTETTVKQDVSIQTVDYNSRYAYNTLNEDEKALYVAILEAAKTCTFKVRVSDAVTTEVWAKVYGMVYNQEPQLFYMNSKVKVGKVYYTENDAAKIAQMQKEIDAVADKLVAEANGKSTTYEKLKVFHDYLVLNSTFEKKEETVEYNGSIYNALAHDSSTQGNIQCSGYAKAMQYLCDKSGIESMIVTGTNKDEFSHAWNVVKVDGAWYNIDATWDDPILKTPDITNIRYNYFLVPDSWIHNKTHFNVNKHKLSFGSITYFTPPACTETAQNYFVKNNKVYSDFTSADKAIKDALQQAADGKLRTAQIMVSSKDVYDQIVGKDKDYNTWVKDNSKKNSVKGIANDSNDSMLLIEFDVIYN